MTTIKLKADDGTYCGCTVHRERDAYAKMCDKHHAEWKERHERAAADHRKAQEEKN